jgi:cation-transporting ATPase 13A2
VLTLMTCRLRCSQVIHPFYVFQIASIVLWSLDDYYYYAFCIALISALSITTTLIDTKRVSAIVTTNSHFSDTV